SWWRPSTWPGASSSRNGCCGCSASEEGSRKASMIAATRALAYLFASLLFILSLRGLSTPEMARRGNGFGVIGMLVAVIVTAIVLLVPGDGVATVLPNPDAIGVLAGALGVGAVIGAFLAARVAMTSMPELVAILHSFVGAAAVLVGIATYL